MTNAFAEWLARYGPNAGEEGPVLFVREVLGIEPDEWQLTVLRAYGRGERRISIRACHGPGKTAVAAWLVLYQMLTRYPQKTVATAPTASQLMGALVPEVKMWAKKLPPALLDLLDIKSEGMYLRSAPEASYFEARTARAEQPEALAGVHSEHVLLVADEASGVPDIIFEAAAGSMSGQHATTLLLGNPVRSSGFFFDTHHKLRDMWFTVHVSHADSPRVTDDFVRDIARRYGENSNAYRIRALGEFPLADDDTIIPFELIETAQRRDIVVPSNPSMVWGLDVARQGQDSCVLVKRSRIHVDPRILAWQGRDTMETSGRVKAEWDKTPAHERPDEILVDVIGIGAGVVDRLRELRLPARGINVAETATLSEKYRNLKTELWFRAAEWLGGRDVKLPKSCACDVCDGGVVDDHVAMLTEEMAAQRFGYTSNGKQLAHPKDEMKKILRRSPDVADAFVLTFASEVATLQRGAVNGWRSFAWNEPVKRNRAVV